MSDQPVQQQPVQQQPRSKYSPRVPYTHTQFITESCIIICDEAYDPAQNRCEDIIICWYPCALVADILCCIPMTFGCYNISKPK